jgi:predicted dehydrogenase
MTNTSVRSNPATPATDRQKIRYAVVGLGWYAQAAALPAFDHAENSEVVAIVSDDPTKRTEVAKKYGIDLAYSYEDYDQLLISGNIDAVYIALPNHLHCDYIVRAAQAGIHVLCEKPMAVTVEECERAIAAAQENNVKLMIAYRLHFEPANMQAIEVIRSGKIGEPRIFNSVFCQQTEGGNTRLSAKAGGGTIEDIGIYCINAARYLFQADPIEVFATSANNGEERFAEVAEMTSAIMRFPGDRLATFVCSFGTAKVSTYQVIGTLGDLYVKPAYTSNGQIEHQITIEADTETQTFGASDQVAAEFVYFSDCIKQDREPEPSGAEGLMDVRIIRALYDSIATGGFVKLDVPQRDRRPSATQIIERPAHEQKAELINAADPAGNN